MVLKLYNTMSRKKEVFKPIDPNGKLVKIYGCGPTVYWTQHIGNLYRETFEDILERVLRFNGYKTNHIRNITDVGHLTSDADEGEDKMVKAIKREKLAMNESSMLKIAEKYTTRFFEDRTKLNLLDADKWPKATEHIEDMIKIVKKMEKKGFTYKTSTGLIFDTSKAKDYEKLGNLQPQQMRFGSRVGVDEERRNKTDFALWVTNQPNHLMQWESPWGRGFPGWHIECSAMSWKYLGEQFDIHTGGEEHIPVHHTNEIAQSEAAFGKYPWVKYWMHIRWLTVKGGKMSKSEGNVYSISDLEEKGFDPLAFRYLTLQGHYRKNLNFDLEALEQAQNSLKRMKKQVSGIPEEGKINKKYIERFINVVNDDLNTPQALAVLWELVRDKDAKNKYGTIKKMDEVFGLGLLEVADLEETPEEIKKMAEEREKARGEKDWARSDELRDEISKKGWKVMDGKGGWELERV
jgi:cysteinyl-tRNA synthetase